MLQELEVDTVARFLKVPKHRAQGAGDGRRARRLAESEPEPLQAHLIIWRTTASWLVAASSKLPVETSSREARGLWREACRCAAPCHRASASSNASCVRPARPASTVVGMPVDLAKSAAVVRVYFLSTTTFEM